MKLSQTFVKTTKTAPADEVSESAKLLMRAGYIYKEMAGVYDFLPLGMRTLDKIIQIIREEMNAIGGQELRMTSLQPRNAWEASGRWSDDVMDVWFKTKLNAGGEVGLGATHEEPLTNLMKSYISSYKDLPVYAYQFQTKFRNELRAKSGIMRTREFMMKDLYSFSKDRAQHEEFYEKCAESYKKIFNRLGIGNDTFRTFASGGAFSKYSDEFQTLCEVGEDIIYLDREKGIAVNEEVYNDEVLADLGLDKSKLEQCKAAEVGNIFTLGYRFSDALDLNFNDEDGKRQKVFMGSYGIGPSRVMGVIAEKLSDDKGLVWPEEIAPYKYYIVAIGEKATEIAEDLHNKAPEQIIFDDRKNARNGEKFADAELLGIPYRVVISDKTLAEDMVEIKKRTDSETKLLPLAEFIVKLGQK
ncbi:MAG: His/Gly/Thr/Pro-type tRNA ligase C-terminal domain-containing protein [Candidatus Saccharibacteria bacterium]|nr:His/Gly/Thr/Pro-type tRNA ligase C-terminal domain-containing protein [Candidatus Saccharibacteria bacterium]